MFYLSSKNHTEFLKVVLIWNVNIWVLTLPTFFPLHCNESDREPRFISTYPDQFQIWILFHLCLMNSFQCISFFGFFILHEACCLNFTFLELWASTSQQFCRVVLLLTNLNMLTYPRMLLMAWGEICSKLSLSIMVPLLFYLQPFVLFLYPAVLIALSCCLVVLCVSNFPQVSISIKECRQTIFFNGGRTC